jgi:hypothetical protein
MKRILSLALVCALAPGLAGATAPEAPRTEVTVPGPAQAPSTDAPLRRDSPGERPPNSPETPPPAVSVQATGARATSRVLVEVLFGGGGFVAGAVIGQALSGDKWLCSGCAQSYNTPVLLGAGLGSGLGVYGAGSLLGGNGSFLATMSGAGLGTAAAFVLLRGTDDTSSSNTIVYTGLVLPLAGAIAGYEVSHALGLGSAPARQWSSERPQLVPVAAATKDGGLLGGLAGRF